MKSTLKAILLAAIGLFAMTNENAVYAAAAAGAGAGAPVPQAVDVKHGAAAVAALEEAQNEQNACPICHDEANTQKKIDLCCNPHGERHVFHFACLTSHAANNVNPRCPLCRKEINKKYLLALRNFEALKQGLVGDQQVIKIHDLCNQLPGVEQHLALPEVQAFIAQEIQDVVAQQEGAAQQDQAQQVEGNVDQARDNIINPQMVLPVNQAQMHAVHSDLSKNFIRTWQWFCTYVLAHKGQTDPRFNDIAHAVRLADSVYSAKLYKLDKESTAHEALIRGTKAAIIYASHLAVDSLCGFVQGKHSFKQYMPEVKRSAKVLATVIAGNLAYKFYKLPKEEQMRLIKNIAVMVAVVSGISCLHYTYGIKNVANTAKIMTQELYRWMSWKAPKVLLVDERKESKVLLG